jgi:hypothetical protein
MEPLLHQFSCAGVLSRRAARRDWLKAEINRLLGFQKPDTSFPRIWHVTYGCTSIDANIMEEADPMRGGVLPQSWVVIATRFQFCQ